MNNELTPKEEQILTMLFDVGISILINSDNFKSVDGENINVIDLIFLAKKLGIDYVGNVYTSD